MVGETLDRQPAAEILREEAHCLRLLEVAHRVHLPLDIAGVRVDLAFELVAPRRPLGLGQQHARVQQFVEQDRVTREVIGRPRRRTHQVGEPRQQRRVLDDEREIGAAPAHGVEQRKQAAEHGVRIGRGGALTRGHCEQLGHELIEALSRGRRQLRVARCLAGMAQQIDQCLRIAEAGLGEPRQRLRRRRRVVPERDVRSGVVVRVSGARRFAQHQGELRLDVAPMPVKGPDERVAARMSHRLRERGELGRIAGQRLRLPVVAILQPVLDVAQERIRVAERATGRRRQHAPAHQRRERGDRAAHAQRGIATAADDLQRLRDEFDLADAARAELDVGARSRCAAPARGSGGECRAAPRKRRSRGTCDRRTASRAVRAHRGRRR